MVVDKRKILGLRLVARIIDGLIMAIVGFIITLVCYIIPGCSGLRNFLPVSIFFVYSIIMHKLYGQTIGKKFMGIKVVGIKKNNMDFLQVLIRDLFVFLLVYFTITIRAVVFFIPQINLIGATLSRSTLFPYTTLFRSRLLLRF